MTRRDEGHGKKKPLLTTPVGSGHARPPGPQETLSHAETRRQETERGTGTTAL